MDEGLPALSDQRLILLQKQSRRMRKSITILNDKLKVKQQCVQRMVDRNKSSDEFRRWQKTIPLKNNLVEMRSLQKCLKKRRESTILEPEITPRNGIYDGAPLDSMKAEVEALIQEKSPRERRQRKVERFKNDGFRHGKLVDYDTSMAKFSEMLTRPKGLYRDEYPLIHRESRPSSALDLLHRKTSPQSSNSYGSVPDSPPQFRLPPIQARRSTIANSSLIGPPSRLFDVTSDTEGSLRSMKRSMSFALAR